MTLDEALFCTLCVCGALLVGTALGLTGPLWVAVAIALSGGVLLLAAAYTWAWVDR